MELYLSVVYHRDWQPVLKHVFNSFKTFTCEVHEKGGQAFTNCTIANIYLNNQKKISTDAVVANRVRSFKKRQKEK